jgi:hypothetical protein
MDCRLRWVLLGGLVGVLTGPAATALAQQAGSGPIISERVGVDGIPNPTADIAIGAGGSPGIGGQTNVDIRAGLAGIQRRAELPSPPVHADIGSRRDIGLIAGLSPGELTARGARGPGEWAVTPGVGGREVEPDQPQAPIQIRPDNFGPNYWTWYHDYYRPEYRQFWNPAYRWYSQLPEYSGRQYQAGSYDRHPRSYGEDRFFSTAGGWNHDTVGRPSFNF